MGARSRVPRVTSCGQRLRAAPPSDVTHTFGTTRQEDAMGLIHNRPVRHSLPHRPGVWRPGENADGPGYVTCLDLGRSTAVLTRGWDREVVMSGLGAGRVQHRINTGHRPPADATAGERAGQSTTPHEKRLGALSRAHTGRAARLHGVVPACSTRARRRAATRAATMSEPGSRRLGVNASSLVPISTPVAPGHQEESWRIEVGSNGSGCTGRMRDGRQPGGLRAPEV